MTAEKNYYDARRNLANSTPQQVSKGKDFAEKFFKDNIAPAMGNATKAYLENFMKEALGLKTSDELADVKRAFEILDYRMKADKLNNPDKYLSWDDKKKKREYEDETARREKEAEKAVKEAEEAAKEAKRKLDEEMQRYREYNEQYTNVKPTPRSSTAYNSGRGERTYTGPDKPRGMSIRTNANREEATENGRDYVERNNSTAIMNMSDRSVGSRYVSRNGDKFMNYDENGNFIGYWSERMTADGFI
jgi:hypothetical protein